MSQITWTTQKRRLKDLIPQEDNPRQWKDGGELKLDKSLNKFGLVDVIVINADNTIISGHRRRERLLLKHGETHEVDCRVPDRLLSTSEVKEYTALANVHAGEWVKEMMGDYFEGIEMDGMAFDMGDLEVPEMEMEEPPKQLEAEDDNYVPPAEIVTDIVLGDLIEFRKGELRHRLLCGDSTNVDDLEKLMGGEKADMVFTDPDFSMPIESLLKVYNSVLAFSKNFGFWLGGDKQVVQLACHDFENFVRIFVQDFRNATLTSNDQPMTRTVLIAQMGRRKMNNLHDGFTTLLQIATERTGNQHKITPMAKKVELPGTFINHFSNEREIIIDLFGHSGSTMIAAHQLNRNCRMIEIEPRCCQIILERIVSYDPDIQVYRNNEPYKVLETS